MPTPTAYDLPDFITSVPHWVGWRSEVREGTTKPTKVPYCLKTGRHASNTNPDDWCSFEEAIELVDGYAGLGFVFTKDLEITGIDLDDCILGGVIAEWATPVLGMFKETYSEVSPSTTGIKIWARGSLPGAGKNTYVTKDLKPTTKGAEDCVGAIEMYDTGRYFTVTAESMGGLFVTNCQEAINDLYFRMAGESPVTPVPNAEGKVLEGNRHAFLLATAALWRHSGMEINSIYTGLQGINATTCHPPKSDDVLLSIAEWFRSKPPKYRLTPNDFAPFVGNAVPKEEPAPEEITEERSTDRVDRILKEILDGGQPDAIWGSDLFDALADAGSIKQHEAKRKIKATFRAEVSLREWDSRLKTAEIARQEKNKQFTDYILTNSGEMRGCLANAITALKTLPVHYNSFTARPFLMEKAPWGHTGAWTDLDDAKATEWVQRQGIFVDINTAAVAADTVAREKPHYHPVLEYLKGLKWDGHPRLDRWLYKYMGCKDDPYTRGVAAKWCMSAVKRVIDPNSGAKRTPDWNQADYTLVFEGAQGRRKSTALRTLCGEDWFTDDFGAEIGHKDSAAGLQGKWIVEIGELDAFRKAEMTTIKLWLVRREDRFRKAYGRRAEDFPRQNVFAATTNSTEWLNDDTGGRRFWPVEVEREIDIDGLALARNHIWAEAYARYIRGEKTYFDKEGEALAAIQQYARQDRDIWSDMVEEWIEAPSQIGTATMKSRPGRIYLPEILQHCIIRPAKDVNNHSDKLRLNRILKLAGWEQHRESRYEAADGHTKNYWAPKPRP